MKFISNEEFDILIDNCFFVLPSACVNVPVLRCGDNYIIFCENLIICLNLTSQHCNFLSHIFECFAQHSIHILADLLEWCNIYYFLVIEVTLENTQHCQNHAGSFSRSSWRTQKDILLLIVELIQDLSLYLIESCHTFLERNKMTQINANNNSNYSYPLRLTPSRLQGTKVVRLGQARTRGVL